MKTLKITMTICLALFSLIGFSQTQNQTLNVSQGETTVTNLKIEINVASLQELEKSFKIKDLNEIFSELDNEGDVEFRITCTKASDYDKSKTKEISYKIVGDADEKEAFLKMAERIYNSAKKYYID